MNSIYLAGPTVFFKDAEAVFRDLEIKLSDAGLKGVRPADPIDESTKEFIGGKNGAKFLYDNNTRRIRDCFGVMADLRPFRGDTEPDSGTVFEIGYAVALGKPVAVVLPDMSGLAEKIKSTCGGVLAEPHPCGGEMDAKYGMLIEDFGGPLNLMLTESCSIFPTAEAAIAWLSSIETVWEAA